MEWRMGLEDEIHLPREPEPRVSESGKHFLWWIVRGAWGRVRAVGCGCRRVRRSAGVLLRHRNRRLSWLLLATSAGGRDQDEEPQRGSRCPLMPCHSYMVCGFG
jgi:hypothetical protein